MDIKACTAINPQSINISGKTSENPQPAEVNVPDRLHAVYVRGKAAEIGKYRVHGFERPHETHKYHEQEHANGSQENGFEFGICYR